MLTPACFTDLRCPRRSRLPGPIDPSWKASARSRACSVMTAPARLSSRSMARLKADRRQQPSSRTRLALRARPPSSSSKSRPWARCSPVSRLDEQRSRLDLPSSSQSAKCQFRPAHHHPSSTYRINHYHILVQNNAPSRSNAASGHPHATNSRRACFPTNVNHRYTTSTTLTERDRTGSITT